MILALLLACQAPEGTGGDLPQGPSLVHSPPEGALVAGQDLELSVTASDPEGVDRVQAWHRTQGEEYWTALELDAVDGAWTGTVEGLSAPGVEYYLRGVDGGDPPATSTLPAEGELAPFSLPVGVDALPLPWSEGFEETTADDLADLGWWTPSLAFVGNAFHLADSQAWEGSRAAEHLRGTAGAGALDDWLVSPGLDLSGEGAAMVSWWERGAAADLSAHGLWLSVGARDPAAGDFVELAALAPPPEGAWGQAAVDLSAWAGQPVVYLAWRATGTEADDWWIDGIEVGPLAPLLVDPALSWSPDPASPGQSVQVQVTVDNAVDLAAEGVQASLSLPEGGGSLAAPTVEVGTIAGLSSATATWTLEVDPTWPLHSYLPLDLSFTDGERAWDWSLAMVVGLPSTATVAFTTEQAGTVALDLGVGDPDAALLSIEGESGWFEAGSHEVQVDLTPWPQWLPPAAGEETRWFARLTTSSDGAVDGFSIEHGGVLYDASYLPEIDAGLPATAQVPSPAAPTLQALLTDPDPVAPGASGVSLSITVNNLGAETAGAVTATLVSEDPDATVHDGGPIPLTDEPWSRYDARTVTGPTLDVSAAHLDSSPLALSLLLDDGVDTWTVPVAVAVPWPVPRVLGLRIDDQAGDSGVEEGDGDGLLDAGERVLLSITLGNGGGLDTPGEVQASLAALSGATVEEATQALGVLAAGASVQATWTLTAGEDTLVSLALTLDDGASTWVLPIALSLGERPWIDLSVSDDAVGDALDGYALDLVRARWRTDGLRFELELQAAAAFDPDLVFVEAWGKQSGSPYAYYRWIVQPGATSLQGYLSGSGFTDLGVLTAEASGEDSLLLSWELADMELVGEGFSLGLAAGWCGPPAYYCDHLPDAWGYPYDSFSSASWLPVEW